VRGNSAPYEGTRFRDSSGAFAGAGFVTRDCSTLGASLYGLHATANVTALHPPTLRPAPSTIPAKQPASPLPRSPQLFPLREDSATMAAQFGEGSVNRADLMSGRWVSSPVIAVSAVQGSSSALLRPAVQGMNASHRSSDEMLSWNPSDDRSRRRRGSTVKQEEDSSSQHLSRHRTDRKAADAALFTAVHHLRELRAALAVLSEACSVPFLTVTAMLAASGVVFVWLALNTSSPLLFSYSVFLFALMLLFAYQVGGGW
jgi:hypothetical protein